MILVFNYNEIKYNAEWFKEAHNTFIIDQKMAINDAKTLPLIEKS